MTSLNDTNATLPQGRARGAPTKFGPLADACGGQRTPKSPLVPCQGLQLGGAPGATVMQNLLRKLKVPPTPSRVASPTVARPYHQGPFPSQQRLRHILSIHRQAWRAAHNTSGDFAKGIPEQKVILGLASARERWTR